MNNYSPPSPEGNDELVQDNIVSVRGVNHYFYNDMNRTQVLFDVNLDIFAGQLVVMTGPSGSGKSTLLTILGTVRGLQEGQVTLYGNELAESSKEQIMLLRRKIGFIFQSHHLFTSLTAIENLEMARHDMGEDKEQYRQEALSLLADLGLERHVNHLPQSLSGGQRQRVAVARALMMRPKLILADEPTASLDKVASLEVVSLLKTWVVKNNAAVIMVTHDNRILSYADRIISMMDGAITSDVNIREVIEVCGYLKSIPFFAHLNVSELSSIIDKMTRRSFKKGEVIIQQGDIGHEFFLIVHGSVDVVIAEEDAETISSTIGTGHYFGERALLSGNPRAATIIGKENGLLLTLDKPTFENAISSIPDLKTQLQNLYFAK